MKMKLCAGKNGFTVITDGKRWFSSESNLNDFSGKNAYEILGVSETSNYDEIKSSFRKLAKETHPDLVGSSNDPNSSQKFVQILAAYEILSDSKKRAHYDSYLLCQKMVMQKSSRQGSPMFIYESSVTMRKESEVVEWLKWYRFAINDIVSQEQMVTGSGYFDVLEREFYSSIRAAYYGPVIESMDFLPDRFEAEERSCYETPDVLHLVSGRDLFGIVCFINKFPELSQTCHEKLTSFTSVGVGLCQSIKDTNVVRMDSGSVDNAETPEMHVRYRMDSASDVYKDLELHISGRLVAVANRIPPKSCCNGIQNEDSEDHIHVFLSSNDCPAYATNVCRNSFSGESFASRILLGTIAGLGNKSEEGSCFVYDNSGTKTHVVMKHRTLLVKHLHWYHVGSEVSVCECRCSRARLPPSKFWLFEPRCHTHDIGGWYIETFGRNKKEKTVPSRRQWDGFDAIEQPEKRLHPAMYLLALAYRTLDLEDAKRRKRTVKDIIEPKLSTVLRWCKKLV